MKTHKKIKLDELPKKGTGIDWFNSVGRSIEAEYANEKFVIDILDYNSEKKIVVIKIGDRKPLEIVTRSLRELNLGKYLGLFAGDFKFNVGDVVKYTRRKGEERSLIIIDRDVLTKKKNDGNRYIKRYKYKCEHCENTDFIDESNLKRGGGCNVCGATNPKPLLGYNTIYDLCEYTTKAIGEDLAKRVTKGSELRIKPVCTSCGIQKDKEIFIYSIFYEKSIGCINCSDGISAPNKFAYHLFKSLLSLELVDNYENEYRPTWANGAKYDNYFEVDSKKYILEMDGELGHGTKVHSKSKKTIEETKKIDDDKDEAARNQEIEVIRVDCRYKNNETKYEFMKENLLNSRLNEIVDLSIVDWDECIKKSQGSLIIEACRLRKEDETRTTTEIARIMNMDSNAIRTYLKRGAKFGWCSYDAKEESLKASKKAGEKARVRDAKEVEVYDLSDNLLGVYSSLVELEENSENVFAVKLLKSQVCRAVKRATIYKGFKFKYTQGSTHKELSKDAISAYQMKNANPGMTTKEIANKIGRNYTTVIEYLKDATLKGLCNYDPKKETEKRVKKMIENKSDSKRVGVYNKAGILLKEFDSLHDLERQSYEEFNEKFVLSQISRACNEQIDEYKGYVMKFI